MCNTKFKIIILSIQFLFILNSKGQVDWTKDDRTNLYSEYFAKLSKYSSLTYEQKESISLCCLENTTKSYTKKDFNSKIDIEISRIYESILSQCSNNIGVTLGVPTEEKIETSETELSWDKESKIQLEKDLNSKLEEYSFLKDEQLATLTLCYINKTTEKYTRKEYNEMIEIELKQHQNTTLSKCATLNDIILEKPKEIIPTNEQVFSKISLTGTWNTDDNYSIMFYDNNTFTKQFKSNLYTDNGMFIKNDKSTGDWFFDESSGIITLIEHYTLQDIKVFKTNEYNYVSTSKFKFLNLTTDFFKLQFVEGTRCCNSSDKSLQSVISAIKE